MTKTVYTNYWLNKYTDQKKEHGSYNSEEEAIAGIEAWWELHKDNYQDVQHVRTNTGALEISYGEEQYVYRIEKREIDGNIPAARPKKRPAGEIQRIRSQHNIDQELYLYEELAEPYQDRLITAMHDGAKLLTYIYDVKGRPVKKL
ncbi:hypothetical protein HZY88_03205 [Aerococcaceae bacterium DSM 111176]|nr:hypothetical protein [Aerococcaceae bacterium DSM 111176]